MNPDASSASRSPPASNRTSAKPTARSSSATPSPTFPPRSPVSRKSSSPASRRNSAPLRVLTQGPIPGPTPDPTPDSPPDPLRDPLRDPTPDPIPDLTPDPIPDPHLGLSPEQKTAPLPAETSVRKTGQTPDPKHASAIVPPLPRNLVRQRIAAPSRPSRNTFCRRVNPAPIPETTLPKPNPRSIRTTNPVSEPAANPPAAPVQPSATTARLSVLAPAARANLAAPAPIPPPKLLPPDPDEYHGPKRIGIEPVPDSPRGGKPFRSSGGPRTFGGNAGRPASPRGDFDSRAPRGAKPFGGAPKKFGARPTGKPASGQSGGAKTGPDGAPRTKERWRNSFTGKNKGRPKPKAKGDE